MTDLQDALKLLPHGPEFRFLDRLLSLAPGKHGTAEYHVPARPGPENGGRPSFPSVLLIEAGAQLAGVVAQNDPSVPPLPGLKLAAVREVQVLQSVPQGATIRLEAEVTGRMGHLVQAQAAAIVGGRTVMTAQFTLSGTTVEQPRNGSANPARAIDA